MVVSKKGIILSIVLCVGVVFGLSFPISAFARGRVVAMVGSSTNSDEVQAVQEILAKVNAYDPNFAKTADVCLLFLNADYDEPEKVLKALKDNGVNIPLWGATSSAAVMTTEGYEKGGMSMLFLSGESSKDLKVAVASQDLGETRGDAVSAGRKVIKKALAKLRGTPRIILMTSAPGREEAVIEGIESVIGRGIPILGGSSADNNVEGKWKQFTKNRVYTNAVVVAVICTSTRIGYDFANGYHPTRESVYVKSSSEYGRLLEILNDGKQDKEALYLYAKWIGKTPEELQGMNLLGESLLYPLAQHITIRGKDYYITAHPAIGGGSDPETPPEGTMFCFKELPASTRLTLMKAEPDDLINSVGSSIDKALRRGRIRRRNIAALFLVHCAGRVFAIEGAGRSMGEVVRVIKDKIGYDTPFITLFAFGEQGREKAVGNTHGNLSIAPLIFSAH